MTTTTILVTAIPTSARGRVRAFIKAQPGFEAFCHKLGVESRAALNSQLLEFALQNGLMPQVQAIINSSTGTSTMGTPVKSPVTASEEFAAKVASRTPVIHHDVEAGDDFAGAMRIEREKEEAAKAAAIQPTNAEEATRMPVAPYDAELILKSVDQFLSPLVRKELAAALLPVVAAANKPAEVVEKTVTVEVPSMPQTPAGAAPFALRTGGKVEVSKLFGVKTSNAYGKMPITLWNSHGAAPALDPYYVVNLANMALLATAAEHETNVWLVGPGGSGKTTLPEQFCAFTGRPFVKITFTRQTEVGEVVGNTGFREGKTFWEDGALIAAMRRPGTVILFDELTIAPAGVQAIVQAVTDDHRSYTIHATGEVVKAAPGVVFVVADNTNGTGDETGQYAGTNQSNAALVNRFKRMIRVDYMTRGQEVAALVNHTRVSEAAAGHVVDFFSRARKLPDMEGAVLSLRQMTGFVNTVKDGFSSKMAFEVAILNKLASTERAVIEALATLEWNQQFETLLNGSPTAVEPAMAGPSDSRAAQAFDDEVTASLNR